MRPQIEVADHITALPGQWLLTLTHDDGKPVAHRSVVQGWALEAGTLHPYPITVEYGLVVENVAILRPDGAVETHAATFHENEQEWLEDAHAKHMEDGAWRAREMAASEKNIAANAPPDKPASPNQALSPAKLAIRAALDAARKATAERSATSQGSSAGEVSP